MGSDADRVEIVSTVLLAVAAVAIAWSGYQSARWHGEQAIASGRTNAIRIEASRAESLAEAEQEVDVATFIAWVDASAGGDSALADFFQQRFRPEFRPAFDSWIATDPFDDPDAPPTPFAMDDYRLAASIEADRLDAAAEDSSAIVRRSIQRASNYVLAVVLFSVALFFAGMSTRLRGDGPRHAILAISCVVFVGTMVWIATFPISISI